MPPAQGHQIALADQGLAAGVDVHVDAQGLALADDAVVRENRLPFGISACYTSQNLDSISSDAFIDQLTAWGARFIWYFHYMPVGNGTRGSPPV